MQDDSRKGSPNGGSLPPEHDWGSASTDGSGQARIGTVEVKPVRGKLFYPPGKTPNLTSKRRLVVHAALFVVTVATTTLVVSPVYAACIMAILTAHEFGHYFAARHYGVPASLPFFIPFPNLFGTMGAVIRMAPTIPNRRALFDIAAAGPLAGLVLAIPASFVGMMLSEREPVHEESSGIMLGDPLLFQLFERLLHGTPSDDMVLMLHDVGYAGWVGLFVTAINLLPVGQLDGGHISYSVFRQRSFKVALTAMAGLVLTSVFIYPSYVAFLILFLFLGVRHAPTLDDGVPLGSSRTKVALLLLVVFILSFTPTPIMPGL